jgi:hypothetical protein
MFRRIPGFALWLFLAALVAVAPIACGDSSDGSDASNTSEVRPNDMTSAR